jgi:hypothetical protein
MDQNETLEPYTNKDLAKDLAKEIGVAMISTAICYATLYGALRVKQALKDRSAKKNAL